MIPHKLNATIHKSGYLELRNLPFKEGTKIEVIISEKRRNKNLQNLMLNDHVWSEEDIRNIEEGREIINQWKIC
jgi:hypothetical protein